MQNLDDFFVGTYKGYEIYVSDKPEKKYLALVNNRRVYFGAYGYEQYKDKFGYYSEWNHLDKNRRDRYYARHSINYPEGSADWFSKNILW